MQENKLFDFIFFKERVSFDLFSILIEIKIAGYKTWRKKSSVSKFDPWYFSGRKKRTQNVLIFHEHLVFFFLFSFRGALSATWRKKIKLSKHLNVVKRCNALKHPFWQLWKKTQSIVAVVTQKSQCFGEIKVNFSLFWVIFWIKSKKSLKFNDGLWWWNYSKTWWIGSRQKEARTGKN